MLVKYWSILGDPIQFPNLFIPATLITEGLDHIIHRQFLMIFPGLRLQTLQALLCHGFV